MQLTRDVDYSAVLHTSAGDITVALYRDDAPKTVNNFVFLARQGFYDGVPFHRVIRDFMIQTGDPTGTGSGGPGYRFNDEQITREYVAGTLAMANAGPHTNGSQFFICHTDCRRKLAKAYTIFGKVTAGMDVVDAIATSPVQRTSGGEASAPQNLVKITSIDVQETPT
jgi:peptidylprolyl isomerase